MWRFGGGEEWVGMFGGGERDVSGWERIDLMGKVFSWLICVGILGNNLEGMVEEEGEGDVEGNRALGYVKYCGAW